MRWFRRFVLVLIGRPIARVFTGADIVGREKLPLKGPAILAANHASHVDTILMLTLYPSKGLDRVRPAAAADYFLRGGLISWLSNTIIGIVPVARDKAGTGVDVLEPVRAALKAGDIVLIFPEGTRGDGEEMAQLKSGVARLAADVPEAPVYPIWLQGAGRVLPKGEALPVPMNCTVLVGDPLHWQGDRQAFLDELRGRLEELKAKAPPQRWA
ncbi:MAG: 1-acyl-sn-glycerol-3-phosphate acyltransferase [Phenylobacterium sp.]|nr:1-acyl-sn-glycerol-3-phosphate acyltransferase [Phenylobacterium sp.]